MTAVSTRKQMRPFGELMPFADALDLATGLARPLDETRQVPIFEAGGRILCEDIASPVDVPAVDRAAMDGYAARAADLVGAGPDSPARLRCVGSLLAGLQPSATVEPASCLEIATGAPLPHGSDAVVPVEDTDRQGDTVTAFADLPAGANVSKQGEDLRQGEMLGAAGNRVTPALVAALASVGTESVRVWRRPRVLLLPTGDELVPIGQTLPPGHVYDSNSVALQALITESGGVVEREKIIGDDPEALSNGLLRSGFDLVVTLGGTSVGRHDLVLDVVAGVGQILVHGVAVKPGKPLLLARVGERPTVGLPGFPTSSLLLGYAVLEPMIRRMARLPGSARESRTATLSEPVRSPPDKHQLLTVRLDGNRAVPAYRASSTITSMSQADGWIEIDAATEHVDAGERVEVKLF